MHLPEQRKLLSAFFGSALFKSPYVCIREIFFLWNPAASVSVRFRSKEWGTRVKDRAKLAQVKERGGVGEERKETFLPFLKPSFPSPHPASFIFWFSFHFSRGQNRKSLSTVFFCSETKRKRLLRRLVRHPESWVLESRIQLKESGIALTIGIQSPTCTDKDWNPVHGIRNPPRGVQNP